MHLPQLDFEDPNAPLPCEEYTDAASVVWPVWWRSEFDGRTVRHEAPSTLLF